MNHYDAEAWVSYRNNRIDEEQRRLMEEHLAVCDSCLQRYLDAAAEHESALAELLLPPDFSALVKEKIGAAKEQPFKRRRSRALVNYTVAAAITLALMSGGIFDFFAREIPGFLAETGQLSQTLERKARRDTGDLLKNARTGLENIFETKEE